VSKGVWRDFGPFRVHCKIINTPNGRYAIELCVEKPQSKGLPSTWPLPRNVVFDTEEEALNHSRLVLSAVLDVHPITGEPSFGLL